MVFAVWMFALWACAGCEYAFLSSVISETFGAKHAGAIIGIFVAAEPFAVGIVVLVTGILLTVAVGKGMNFYIHNPVYDLKVGLFLGAVAATLYPTWFLQSRRRIPDDDDDDVQVPRTILYIIRAKLAVLTTLPLFAVMMAQGIGLG